jgi:NAD(P)-dependent dehydrogenase (short-subunit alcohol dehydrogenase family)
MGLTMAERKAVTKTIATRYKPDREVPQRGDVVPAERCRSGADRLMNSGAEMVGGKAVPVVGDVRREEDVQRAIDTAAERFGGVDLCVNNASAIAVEPTELVSANPRATSAEGKP